MLTSDDYEAIVYEHDFQYKIINQALDVVKKYIQRKKLILVGGMAIDIALKTKNKQLYNNNKQPDYDFFSSEHHKDAYDLGYILAKQFDNVSVINAFHVSTMRVRVNFTEVADISYIPKELINKIPTLRYQGFVVVHPHFQMIDQHRSLSMPFELPPLETVFGRWKKDIKRYDLLSSNWEINKEPTNEKLIKYNIKYSLLKNHCLSGYPALLYWLTKAKADGYKSNVKYTYQESNDSIICSIPKSASVNILTDEFETVIKTICNGTTKYKVRRYNPILDKVPNRAVLTHGDFKYVILNNYGSLRSVYKDANFTVGNLQEIMCYMLTMGIFYHESVYINGYLIAKDILLFAADKYKKSTANSFKKYLPTTEVYGKANIYAAYTVAKHRVDVQFKRSEQSIFTPKNAYPKKNENIKRELYDFDPSNEKIFQFNGEEITN